MSRMLNVVREAAARPADAVVAVAPVAEPVAPRDDSFADDGAPFVEIGGPSGPVFSAAVPARPVAVAEAKPLPAFPRLAEPAPVGGPTFLSVTFHELLAAAREGVRFDGPAPELVALHHPDHPVSGEYRVFRDEVRRQLPDAAPHALLFTAAAPEAGTTTVLLNLAVTLAQGGQTRVLVVDANTARPAVASRLALKNAPGLCEVLAQTVPLAWAVQPSAVPNLQVLAAGIGRPDTPTALADGLPGLLPQLRQWFDWVLVDGGVWGEVPERDGACPAADAVYLVTREPHVGRPEFAGLRGWVKELGGLLRGFVTTRV